LVAELLPTYIQHLPEQIASINNSLAQHDRNALSMAVLRLKGSGGSYGFECLSNVVGKAESCLHQRESLDVIKQQVDSLVELVRSIRGYDPKAEIIVEPATNT
jgi:HPt (histidine-containing phosphotransfer) domain-containing protein